MSEHTTLKNEALTAHATQRRRFLRDSALAALGMVTALVVQK